MTEAEAVAVFDGHCDPVRILWLPSGADRSTPLGYWGVGESQHRHLRTTHGRRFGRNWSDVSNRRCRFLLLLGQRARQPQALVGYELGACSRASHKRSGPSDATPTLEVPQKAKDLHPRVHT